MLRFSSLLLLSVFMESITARDLPSYFPRCVLDDPQLNDCILNATKTLKPQIRRGVPEIKLIAFDPLIIPSFSINQTNGNFRYNTSLTNFIIRGLDDYDFDEIRYDPKSFVLNGRVRFKDISVSSAFDASAWFFYFPAIGNGMLDAVMDFINGTFKVEGELIAHRKVAYFQPKLAEVRMIIKGVTIHTKGLFASNPELEYLTNELANLNAQRIVDAATPALETLTEGFLINYVKTLTKLIPYQKLFPHSQIE